jgi:hypothetical protein
MSDAYTHWIAPFWMDVESPQTSAVEGARVYVMNPGIKPAKVTTSLRDLSGSDIWTGTATIAPQESQFVNVTGELGTQNGWCGISSDVPILPWGITQYDFGDAVGYANMVFFKVDPLVIEIDPGAVKQLADKLPR